LKNIKEKRSKKHEKDCISLICKKQLEEMVRRFRQKRLNNINVEKENKKISEEKKLKNKKDKILMNRNYEGLVFTGTEQKSCENCNRLYPKNETINIQKIKSKIPKCPPNNNIKTIQDKKLKSIKKESSNLLNDNKIPNSLLHPIPGISSASNNYLFQNRSLLPSNSNSKSNFLNPIPNPQTSSISPPPPKQDSQISSATSAIANELKHMEYMKDLIQSIFGSPLGLSSLDSTNQTPVELSPEIFRNTCKNFEISITSHLDTLDDSKNSALMTNQLLNIAEALDIKYSLF